MLGVRSVRSVGILSVKGDPFVACDVCAFPVWRPCYEYERKDRNQSCPQCKTRYKRLKGSPAIPGDREEDIDGDDETTNFPFSSQTQNEKQKTSERMLNWHMTYGRGMIIVLQIMIKRFLISIYLFSPVDMRFLGSCLLLPLNIFRSPLLDLRI